jgi:hypothetical protein
MVLELVARPSVSTRSSVNTSPLAWGSMRTVMSRGRVSPAKVDRARLIFQVPKTGPPQQAAPGSISKRTDHGRNRYSDLHAGRLGERVQVRKKKHNEAGADDQKYWIGPGVAHRLTTLAPLARDRVATNR